MSDVGNNGPFYGQNAPGVEYDRPERVTYQTMIHAGGEAFAKAAQAGVNGGNADLYVDQEPCSFCCSAPPPRQLRRVRDEVWLQWSRTVRLRTCHETSQRPTVPQTARNAP
jgi:deoxycytidylate deaminase